MLTVLLMVIDCWCLKSAIVQNHLALVCDDEATMSVIG